ncbi:MAG: hypothetical protein BIFFINMI_03099 [Phycisphaerae bacterium]|nr:hypothetical protein [Phycisphaerae bacterium]
MVSRMMEETWRWKDEASKATEGMTRAQLLEHYRRARLRAEKESGVKLKTVRPPRRSRPAK